MGDPCTMYLLFFVFAAVFSHPIQCAVQKTNIIDYLDVLNVLYTSTTFDSCNCLFEGITKGFCNSLCSASTCTTIISEMVKCAENTTICSSNSCATNLNNEASSLCSDASVQSLFESQICRVKSSSIYDLARSTTLNISVRSSCSSISLSDSSCITACSATTCRDYIGNVSSCISAAGMSSCATSIVALSEEISALRLDCDFDLSTKDGSLISPCTTQSPTTFEQLIPSYSKFKLGKRIQESCYSCLNSVLSDSTICATRSTACDIISAFKEASNGCSESDCGVSLTSVDTFLDRNVLECSSNYSSICRAIVDAIKGDYETPVFNQVPRLSLAQAATPSNTPTISFTASNTSTMTFTPSNTPTTSFMGSVTPTTSSSSNSCIAVTWVLFISLFTFIGTF
eukprot:c93_g1_i1.p1 GENE.c93_g1_i1~~c93_g1_i1.p1  ORF type:complete len:399 (+),score=64.44 c93_g1_i1:1-1197(+)